RSSLRRRNRCLGSLRSLRSLRGNGRSRSRSSRRRRRSCSGSRGWRSRNRRLSLLSIHLRNRSNWLLWLLLLLWLSGLLRKRLLLLWRPHWRESRNAAHWRSNSLLQEGGKLRLLLHHVKSLQELSGRSGQEGVVYETRSDRESK